MCNKKFSMLLIYSIGWFIFMNVLSHQSGKSTKKISYGLVDRLNIFDLDAEVMNVAIRKSAHVITYLILQCLWELTVTEAQWERWLRYLPLMWAVIDEQSKQWLNDTGIVTERHCDSEDICLNILGVVIGHGLVSR